LSFLVYATLNFLSRFSSLILRLSPKKLQNALAANRTQLKPLSRPLSHKNAYWFHSASGEFEYAVGVIRELKVLQPNSFIFVSFTSSSYAKVIQSSPLVDACEAMNPVDQKRMRQIFETLRPKFLLFARTDIWPQMIFEAKRQNVPTILFACSWPRMNLWRSWLYSQLDNVYWAHKVPQGLHAGKGTQAVQNILGDPRVDQALLKLSESTIHPLPTNESQLISSANETCLILGSTWPEDEAIWLNAIKEFTHTLKIIWVAHEPSTIGTSKLRDKLKSLGRSPVIASEILALVHQQDTSTSTKGTAPQIAVLASAFNKASDLIVDEKGYLFSLYQIADLAFVGGSFSRHVHSVLEATAAGCLVAIGPKHEKNSESQWLKQTYLKDLEVPAVTIVNDEKEISDWVNAYCQKVPPLAKNRRETLRFELHDLILHKRGASQQIARRLVDMLDSILL